MDSVIAKLDNSVFGMLTDQEPRILIDGICSPEETKLVNKLRPDFVRFDNAAVDETAAVKEAIDNAVADETAADRTAARSKESGQSIVIAPGIKVISSMDEIPIFSSASERRALSIDTSKDASKLPSQIRAERPDLLIIKLASHDEAALNSIKKLVCSARSVHQDFVD